VPYLRDRDIRQVELGESPEDKTVKLLSGIKNHYEKVYKIAAKKMKELQQKIPLIIMGHLFADGGKTIDGDGVRELYIGTLSRVGLDLFPEQADYVALGHLHVAQEVKGRYNICYSGAPVPIGFNESGIEKKVIIIEFNGADLKKREVSVPVFKRLVQIKGDFQTIKKRIEELKQTKADAWVEIIYSGKDIDANLNEKTERLVKETDIEILRIKNLARIPKAMAADSEKIKSLAELSDFEVFTALLDAHDIGGNKRKELIDTYKIAVKNLYEEENN
jgi:exonuclease SbcD